RLSQGGKIDDERRFVRHGRAIEHEVLRDEQDDNRDAEPDEQPFHPATHEAHLRTLIWQNASVSPRLAHVIAAGIAISAMSCLSPTEIVLVLSTNIACGVVAQNGVAIAIGE